MKKTGLIDIKTKIQQYRDESKIKVAQYKVTSDSYITLIGKINYQDFFNFQYI